MADKKISQDEHEGMVPIDVNGYALDSNDHPEDDPMFSHWVQDGTAANGAAADLAGDAASKKDIDERRKVDSHTANRMEAGRRAAAGEALD